MNIFPEVEIFRTSIEGDFLEQMLEILGKIRRHSGTPVRIVIFAQVANNEEFKQYNFWLNSAVRTHFGALRPATLLVAQTPLACNLAAEVHFLRKNIPTEQRLFGEKKYLVAEKNGEKALFFSDVALGETAQAATEVFQTIEGILKQENLPFSSIVRQWNYIEKITFKDEKTQNYQEFNNVRKQFYSRHSWGNGYPAATGIGTNAGGVAIDITALSGVTSRPIDNPLQTAAYDYSKLVLFNPKNFSDQDEKKLSAPLFERARFLESASEQRLLISGTAAIRNELTFAYDATNQAILTVENIKNLLEQTDIQNIPHVRIYVKNYFERDIMKIARIVRERLNPKQAIFLLCDICREELLLEIEGFGIKENP